MNENGVKYTEDKSKYSLFGSHQDQAYQHASFAVGTPKEE
jgi:hypothetical protein